MKRETVTAGTGPGFRAPQSTVPFNFSGAMEATVVCVDNSEWTRNGDYAPTRFQAQADAVNLLAGAKTQANPENTVHQRSELAACLVHVSQKGMPGLRRRLPACSRHEAKIMVRRLAC